MNVKRDLPCEAVTSGPKHYFFGYYGICPWDLTGRYILCMESEFCDRPPNENDKLFIGFIDTEQGNLFTKAAETTAWNFQQGCFLRWNPSNQREEVVYNDRRDGDFISVILNIFNGQKRILPRPVYDISPDGSNGLSLNFARLNDTRPGYGYAGVEDRFKDEQFSDKDGIFAVDMKTGESKLIISYAQIAENFLADEIAGRKLWFNHIMFNKNGSRFVFLARYSAPKQPSGAFWLTSMFTANTDGSDIYCLSKNKDISHFDWYDNDRLAVWTEREKYGKKYYLITDKTQYYEIIGRKQLNEDGHGSYSPDGKWLLTDTYPDEKNYRSLILFNLRKEKKVDIGRFKDLRKVWGDNWDIRCDLHPRWNRDGTKICFDSVMDGSRQMYVSDVSELVEKY